MTRRHATYAVEVREVGGALLEWYRYEPGVAGVLPKHAHAEYQFCLSPDWACEYQYRGASTGVPVDALCVLHPGEVHTVGDTLDRPGVTSFCMLYLPPTAMQDAAEAAGGPRTRRAPPPFIATPVLREPDLVAHYARAHAALMGGAARLEQDARLLTFLTQLVGRHADSRPAGARRHAGAGAATRRVREYLHAHYAENVALSDLAALAGLSTYHLLDVFKRDVGLPPHAYQTQLRVERAKRLLARGQAPSEVALSTGFYDQSHLGRHFRRLVGASPGAYAARRST